MHRSDDSRLETLLAETLAERAERITASVTREQVHARREETRRRRRRGSVQRPLALLGVAAALLLPFAAMLVLQRPPSPAPVLATGYEALVRRSDGDEWHLVAVRGDGQERSVARVPRTDLGFDHHRPMSMAVSDDGWLATTGTIGWEFTDLRGPGRDGPIRLAPYPGGNGSGQAWMGGDGRLLGWGGGGDIQLLDPRDGTVRSATITGRLTSSGDRGLREVVALTADGTGIVTGGPTILDSDGRHGAGWATLTIDGGDASVRLGDVDLGWRTDDWWRADGSRVQLCFRRRLPDCAHEAHGTVIVEAPDGTLTSWYPDDSPREPIDASFGHTGVWVLLDRPTRLVHIESPGVIGAVWPVSIAPNESQTRIKAVAPDDSLVAVRSPGGDVESLIDGATGHESDLAGNFVQFIPSAVLETWLGDDSGTTTTPPAVPLPSGS